jgi:hypothetical protein
MSRDEKKYYVKITPGPGCEHFQSLLQQMVDSGLVSSGRVNEFYPDRFDRKMPGYAVVAFEPFPKEMRDDKGEGYEAGLAAVEKFLSNLRLNILEGKVIDLEELLREA